MISAVSGSILHLGKSLNLRKSKSYANKKPGKSLRNVLFVKF